MCIRDRALLAAGLLLACAVPRLCLVLETGWHCEPITAIQPERITRGPAAGTWADTKAADMQECLYEACLLYTSGLRHDARTLPPG